jgi:hypothetical protein
MVCSIGFPARTVDTYQPQRVIYIELKRDGICRGLADRLLGWSQRLAMAEMMFGFRIVEEGLGSIRICRQECIHGSK